MLSFLESLFRLAGLLVRRLGNYHLRREQERLSAIEKKARHYDRMEKGLRARHRARDAVASGRLSDDRYRRGRGD
ncbi:MAG: hypothetical protein JJ891_07240 [Rhizobiaceae bacterium]|jgi:hypothetical protein|nr:hypothetical protein [Rhizobiaceae bacterium]